MSDHNDTGKIGEEIAVQYLTDKGYTILHTNWRFHPKELDIVALDDKCLVVVEVKTRTFPFLIDPLDSITQTKIKHIIRATQAYIFKYNVQIDTRFDIIIVTINNDKSDIEHIEDAFFPETNNY